MGLLLFFSIIKRTEKKGGGDEKMDFGRAI
jgi:hypothetical protein